MPGSARRPAMKAHQSSLQGHHRPWLANQGPECVSPKDKLFSIQSVQNMPVKFASSLRLGNSQTCCPMHSSAQQLQTTLTQQCAWRKYMLNHARACSELACSQRGKISWMFWPMRSQRQLPHQTPRALPRLPLTPPAQGQNVFSSTVFCLHISNEMESMQGI